MNPFKEKIIDYLDEKNEYMQIEKDKDFIKCKELSTECMNLLSDYLEKYEDKEIIKDMVANILIADNQVSNIIRCYDFKIAFFIGLKIGAKSTNEKYDDLIKMLNNSMENINNGSDI